MRGPAALLSSLVPSALGCGAVMAGCGLTADWNGIQNGSVDAGGGVHGPDASGTTTKQGEDAATSNPPPPPPTFCALHAADNLCADFDEGEPIDTGWDSIDTSGDGSGTVTLTPNAFSHPSAFQSSIFTLADQASGRLMKMLPTQGSHVRMDFEMLFVSGPTNTTMELAVLHEYDAAQQNTYGVFLEDLNGALEIVVKLVDQSQAPGPWMLGAPPSGWTHFVIDVDVADSGSLTVVQDNNTVVSATNVPTSDDNRDTMFVEIGLYDFNAAAAQANFDNIVLDWQ